MRWLLSLIVVLLLIGCQSSKDVTSDIKLAHQSIDDKVSGELAYDITAYVEQYWRVVGNSGFDSSVYRVARELEKVGYLPEASAGPDDRLTYRLEKRPLDRPTWEPVDARLGIVGTSEPLLEFESNRNMIAINSFSTNTSAKVVWLKSLEEADNIDIAGKVVYIEASPSRVYKRLMLEGNALGLLTYNNPTYLQPEKNTTSIQFRRIPYDEDLRTWCIPLSYKANEVLKSKLLQGEVVVEVDINTNIYTSEELTLVADIRGSSLPDQRMVFSAHVQEPGANDNASGVGAQMEMAAVMASMVREGSFDPRRTLTFLWGDEIVSTRRYVKEDSIRAKNIKWGISLDMVGENTAITGGSFLIEKMPDPSAIWTRGKDEHTEWGGRPLTGNSMKPHYLNDLAWHYASAQGKAADWKVKTNPYEGGSDHVPFLRADIPSVLFWHFTDQFYHTDNDRLDKVSQTTLSNVAITSLKLATSLLNADEHTALEIIEITQKAGYSRLAEELKQGNLAVESGESVELQKEIIQVWAQWYRDALETISDISEHPSVTDQIMLSQEQLQQESVRLIGQL